MDLLSVREKWMTVNGKWIKAKWTNSSSGQNGQPIYQGEIDKPSIRSKWMAVRAKSTNCLSGQNGLPVY